MEVDRRYQVFVSSTYTDLLEERQEVIQALLELDLMPAGMELFPASDDDRWSLIRQVIDDSDYYLVIVGGRYGSVDEAGVSYTEREYDYAVESGKPVLGFVHAKPDDIPAGKTEVTEAARERLDGFRAKVQERMCKMWETPDELGGVVSRSLVKLMKQKPAEGWVRGQHAASPEIAAEVIELRAQVASLEQQQLAAPVEDVEALAQGSDHFDILYTIRAAMGGYSILSSSSSRTFRSSRSYTWDELFALLGPLMLDEASETSLRNRLEGDLAADGAKKFRDSLQDEEKFVGCNVSEDAFQAIKVQLFALALIQKSVRKRGVQDKNTYWSLSPSGEAHLMRQRAIRRTASSQQDGAQETEAPLRPAPRTATRKPTRKSPRKKSSK